MKRKMLSLLLAALPLMGAFPAEAFAGYENFSAQADDRPGQFADVPESAWYAENVRMAYEYGLINGQSATSFAPDSNLTIAEAVKLAACLRRIYTEGEASFETSEPWYRSYADYALANGVLTEEPDDYRAIATRAEFAVLLAEALPEGAMEPVNEVDDGAVPDVSMDVPYAGAVYLLYRTGVLTGSDAEGRFRPDSSIKRSEAAAIVTRIADPSLRQTVTLHVLRELTKDEIYEACMPAVFKLYAYDTGGSLLAMGSGVLISADGDAVTCGHVANGVYRLAAELLDGTRYEVSMYDMDAGVDIAYIHLAGSGLPYLEIWDEIAEGSTVYALGYPGGGAAKVTAGRVSDPRSTAASPPMIESTAAVISGNSGGALVDGCGRLVGVTVSSASSGRPSYSVPVSALDELKGGSPVSVSAYTQSHRPDAARCYIGQYPVPDFGKVTGVPLLAASRGVDPYQMNCCYYYKLSDLPGGRMETLQRYYTALNENTFYLFSGSAFTSSAGYRYSVQLFETTYRGSAALCVSVTGLQTQPVGGLPRLGGAVELLEQPPGGESHPAYGSISQ